MKATERPTPQAVALVANGTAAPIYVDAQDVQPAGIAAQLLADDVQRVTGRMPPLISKESSLTGDAVIVGTLGHSAFIDRLAADGKIDVSGLRGEWEAYTIQVVEHPTDGIHRALVIAGSDRRGTAYGAVTVSQAIGVSPWYFWADVPVQKKSSLYLSTQSITEKPVVKYRGIFLNDEAPALTGWVEDHFGDYNHRFYANVFELLLRLKANYLWPAMWNNCFNEDDPLNPKLANDYGIVMGTSHVEPMMRADKEWNRAGYTQAQWNYEKFPKELQEFWKQGLERNKPYENIITVGMRGKIDTPMSETANISLLERIVADQRKLIAEVINPDPAKVPQLWALYKEVQEYYEKGMRVPDDVTLLWCDDNWGNLRRLPTPEERTRPGGAGIYYHFDYVGGPRNYKWLNTVPTTKIWEQMNLAYRYGATRIWIVNVGDLKPMEFPIDFFMTMAWNPEQIGPDGIADFGKSWAARTFGPAHADEIADVLEKYTKLNGRRKPELLDPSTFSPTHYHEAERVLAEWKSAVDEAEAIEKQLLPEQRDAYFELVLYPTQASANLTELYITAGLNHLYADQGRASTNDLADKARRLFRKDADLADAFNHQVAGGKWNHMMDQTHIGYTGWQQPPRNVMPEVREISVPNSPSLGVAVEGSATAWPGGSGSPVLPAFDAVNKQVRTIDLFNRGKEPVDFTAKTSAPWIVLSAASGQIDQDARIQVSVDWSKVKAPSADGRMTIAAAGREPIAIAVHAFCPPGVTAESLNGFAEGDGCVSIEAEHFTSKHDADAHWEKIPDFGRTLSGMTLFPVTAASVAPPDDSACLEYRMFLFDAGDVDVTAIVAPTLNFLPGRGLRYAISFDDQPPQVIDLLARNSLHDWETSVKDAVRYSHSHHVLKSAGYHTLKFWQVDPGVVLEKLVVDFGGVKPSYLGPPESFRHVAP
ncbi:MAG: glycosyl hydrolase 115 family protein [Phycisphaerae bacterium]